MIRIPIFLAVLLVAGILPLAAQEHAPPPAGPPPIERLERLRLERMKESLGLSEEQTETLRRQLDENRAAVSESFERQHAAMEALHESLKDEPADQDALRRALADVEAAREEMERLREQQIADLRRTLTIEQRAKFLLFNRQFDLRLRELVERHHGRGAAAGEPGAPSKGPEQREPTREQKIEFLEKRISEMQQELEELRSGTGS